MATLSIQLRLGLSRGWRVRSLIKAKFYAQSVVHCLFIFSVLRARGFTERIWTLNYSVFTSTKKYVIFVEYFKLPDYTSWIRPTRRDYIVRLFRTVNGRANLYPKVPNLAGSSYVIAPYPSAWRHIARCFRSGAKKSAERENLYWFWERRQLLTDFIGARSAYRRINNINWISETSRYTVDHSFHNFEK